MRVGEEGSDIRNIRSNDASTGWAAERYQLSFDRHTLTSRVGGRRRVFARLAPHNNSAAPATHSRVSRPTDTVGSAGIGGEPDAGDSDGLGDADQYFERQMRQLPTTPAHRMVHSDSEADSDSDDEADRNSAEDWRVHQALEQFGQLRRQRFLRDQRQWHNAEITRSGAGALEASTAGAPGIPLHPRSRTRMGSDTPPASHDVPPQLFPSNDVDSYWYNQPPTNTRQQPPVEASTHPTTLRRPGHLPSVPRNPAAELSRSAMLEVLRTHRGFAASHDTPRGSDDLGSTRGQQQQTSAGVGRANADEPELRRNEKVEAQDGGDTGAEDAATTPADDAAQATQRQRQGCARVEGRMLRWLGRNTVVHRGLGCALLQTGIRFAGVQKITPLTREHMGTDALLRMSSPSLEQWDVEVEIQVVDMARGRVAGLMKAINVPRLPKTVVTCWEGEIVDFVNHTPVTGKWRASCAEDARHWSLFTAVHAHPEM
ncbi:hypothetical protein H4R24_000286 [Coemansia sp. RSA 988]|nr:hypothetical protein H4R24_000286 [Coemansia sp. RSA 988]